MPWTPEDAQRHTHEADTPEKQKVWAAVANQQLHTCLREGGSQDECEARAIRVANSVVARMKKTDAPSPFIALIKGKNTQERTVWGYANVAIVDNGNPPDLIESQAWPSAIADFLTRPLLLLMHQPIKAGEILNLKINRRGLWIKAKVTLPQAWDQIIAGKLKGFSIGWLPLPDGYEFKLIDDRLVRVINKLFLFEISLVDHPMNPQSLIEGVEEKMIKDEQISINRQTGEIVVSGLTEDQMAEFMSILDVIMGTKGLQLPETPTALTFKRACPTKTTENADVPFLERLKHILSKEEPMDTKETLQTLESRLKSLEDAMAKLPETITGTVATAIQTAVNEALSAQKGAPEPTPNPAPQPPEDRNAKLTKFMEELGFPPDTVAQIVSQLSPQSQDEKAPTVKEFLVTLNKRLDSLEEAIANIPQASVTQRVRTTKTSKEYQGLPGANLAIKP